MWKQKMGLCTCLYIWHRCFECMVKQITPPKNCYTSPCLDFLQGQLIIWIAWYHFHAMRLYPLFKSGYYKRKLLQPSRLQEFLIWSNFNYLLSAVATSTAQATVQPTIGLLPIPRKPIISTWAGTDEEPANWASECIRPIVSVIP